MAAPKKPTPKKPAARKKSKLTLAGEAAQRGLLLAALKVHRWNLSHVAAALDLNDASTVLRSIRLLGLIEEYDAARAKARTRGAVENE